jgi:hypothetical protein
MARDDADQETAQLRGSCARIIPHCPYRTSSTSWGSLVRAQLLAFHRNPAIAVVFGRVMAMIVQVEVGVTSLRQARGLAFERRQAWTGSTIAATALAIEMPSLVSLASGDFNH